MVSLSFELQHLSLVISHSDRACVEPLACYCHPWAEAVIQPSRLPCLLYLCIWAVAEQFARQYLSARYCTHGPCLYCHKQCQAPGANAAYRYSSVPTLAHAPALRYPAGIRIPCNFPEVSFVRTAMLAMTGGMLRTPAVPTMLPWQARGDGAGLGRHSQALILP